MSYTTTIILLLPLIFALLILLYAAWWFSPIVTAILFKGAPYVPTSQKRLELMLKLAHITPNDSVIDIGSGDGRTVFKAAEFHPKRSVGIEINPTLIWYCYLRTRFHPERQRIQFIRQSFHKFNFSPYTVVFVYQLPNVMSAFEERLKSELPVGARVISNGFSFKHWTPEIVQDGVRVYIKS